MVHLRRAGRNRGGGLDAVRELASTCTSAWFGVRTGSWTSATSIAGWLLPFRATARPVPPALGRRARTGSDGGATGSAHEGHELGGHDHDGAHHVAVLVLEDVAVVHVAAGVGGEADGELDELVGVDPHGVLEPSLVGVDDVVELVIGISGQPHGGGHGAVADPARGGGDRDRAAPA